MNMNEVYATEQYSLLSEEIKEGFRDYLVTLTKGGRSFFVTASSSESARQIVLDFEPYYNPEWGLVVRDA